MDKPLHTCSVAIFACRQTRAQSTGKQRTNKGRGRLESAAPGLGLIRKSEYELTAKLQQAGTVIAGYVAEVAVVGTIIEALKFRVVEGVEGLEAQFEFGSFVLGKRNGLEQGQVPVE
jgi:hypothetical protein